MRDVQVLKGKLAEPTKNAYVEVNWPINLGIDPLVSATPIGARVIVLADGVSGLDGAVSSAETVGAATCVQPNLLGVAPYGLLIEGVDGQTHAPMWNLGWPLVVRGAESLNTFEGALSTIRSAAR